MRTLALFLGSTEDQYGQDLIHGAHEACAAAGVRLLCVSSGTLMSYHGMEAQRNVLYDVVRSGSVDAILVSGSLSHNVGQEVLLTFCRQYEGIPLVTIAIKLPGFPGVLTRAEASLGTIMDHLISHHGYGQFAWMGGPPGQQESEERAAIFVARLAAHGIAADPALMVNGDFTRFSGQEAMNQLLSRGRPFRALVCANDSMALGAIEEARKHGIRVPADLAVTGFDDIVEGRFSDPPLTTVRQSSQLQAREAATLAIAMMEHGRGDGARLVQSEPIIRSSCGCPLSWMDALHAESILHPVPVHLLDSWNLLRPDDEAGLISFMEDLKAWVIELSQGDADAVMLWKTVSDRLRIAMPPWKDRVMRAAELMVMDTLLMQDLRLQVSRTNLQDQLRFVREALLSSFDLDEVYELVKTELPRIGYTSLWLSLFEDVRNPVGMARICASTVNDLALTGQRFPSQEILPGGLSALGDRFPVMVMEALYSRDMHLGFMVIASSLELSRFTGTLRTQISGAIHGSLLLGQKEAAIDQLVANEKATALGKLVAGIAHEINTPLGVALGASTFLESRIREIARGLETSSLKRSELVHWLAQGGETSAIISQNLMRAADLVASFKQVAADQTSEIRRSFLLLDYIQEVLVSLLPSTRRYPGIQIAVEGDPDISIDSYPGALAQILTNLVTNALLHAFDPDSKGCITITVKGDAQHAALTFSDDGKGIEPAHLNQIFDPFFTTKRGQGGTGLGLHIIHNLVFKVLCGSISCESKPGQGTTFVLTLPRVIQASDS